MHTQNWKKYKQLLIGGSGSARETMARSLQARCVRSVVYRRNGKLADNPGVS